MAFLDEADQSADGTGVVAEAAEYRRCLFEQAVAHVRGQLDD